jgi:hypothetical protein
LSARHDQLLTDILRDISSFQPPDRAKYFASLGHLLWDTNKEQGRYWTTKGVELALDPTTPYKNKREQVEVLKNILIANDVLKNDEVLAKRLIEKLGQLLLQTSSDNDSEYNGSMISLASNLVQKMSNWLLTLHFDR